jgi:CDP-diacylglycerol pyrophosphatase
MRLLGWINGLLIAAAVLVGSIATASLAGNFGRDALRQVIGACVLSKSTLGLSFPCADVALDAPGSKGHVLIRSPGFQSEFLVAPLTPLDGIESPELQDPAATGLWQVAWSSRAEVEKALGRPLARSAVALAVNAHGTRTQDHFHIHIDCLRQSVGSILAAKGATLTDAWRKFPGRLMGETYWARAIASPDLSGVNIADLVAGAPPGGKTPLDHATVAIAAGKLADGSDGFYLLANWNNSSAERLLDHDCKAR